MPEALQLLRSAPTGIGWAPLGINVATQGMYVGVAALGVSFLLAPFGGPTVPALLLGAPGEPAAIWPAEALLGAGVAVLSLRRGGFFDTRDAEGTATLEYGAAQAEQMRPLYEITGGEARLPAALGAILVWQLAIATAEELYYRGLVQSAVRMLSSAILPGGGAEGLPSLVASGRLALVEALALVVGAVLFGLVHTEFVGDASAMADATAAGEEGGSAADEKAEWFRVTATYGALYGLLHSLSGHRLAAPICAHAGFNIGLCVRDWGRMRRTGDEELTRIFAPAPR